MPLFGRKKHVPADVAEPAEPPQLPWRSLEQQRDALLADVEPLRPFGVQINDVLGLTLCEDIVSDLDLPMVTTARIAGFGLRAANIVGATGIHPIDLRVMGVIERRDLLPSEGVAPGACVLLAAGAPAPKGVDAVVPLEDAQLEGRVATFRTEIGVHANLSVRGSTLADGATLLQAGSVLNARAIALLAEVGLDKVLVRPKPRLVVFSVGADLVAPGLPITSIEQHYSAATPLVAAAARAAGATVYPLDLVAREASALRQTIIDQAIRADAMVVLAAEEEDADALVGVLRSMDAADLALVRFATGRTISVGRVGEEGIPVLVLPAGAVHAYAAHELLVKPLLDRLGARDAVAAARRRVRLGQQLDADPDGESFVAAQLRGEVAHPLAGGDLALELFRADVILIVPAGNPLGAGAEVDCLTLDAGAVAAASE